MRRGWVYALCEPDSCVIRYIGVSYDPVKRLRSHLKQARTAAPGAYLKTDWLQSLNDSEPTLLLLEEADYDNLPNLEKSWIARSRAAGALLTNQRNGGLEPQNRGRKRSPETRARIREARARQTFDDESRERMSAAQLRIWSTRDDEFRAEVGERGRASILKAQKAAQEVWKGRKHTDESRAKMRDSKVGKTLSLEHRNAIRKGKGLPPVS